MNGFLVIASILFSAYLALYGWRVLKCVEFFTDGVTGASADPAEVRIAAVMEKLWELFQMILVVSVIGQAFSIVVMVILPTLGGLSLFFFIVFPAGVLIIFDRRSVLYLGELKVRGWKHIP